MAQLPVHITIDLTSFTGEPYTARVVGWGIDRGGHYGSLWSVRIDDIGCSADSPAREVLAGLSRALDLRAAR